MQHHRGLIRSALVLAGATTVFLALPLSALAEEQGNDAA
jgi:hypothetical protein